MKEGGTVWDSLIFLSLLMLKALKILQLASGLWSGPQGTSEGVVPPRYPNYLAQVALITSYLNAASSLVFKLISWTFHLPFAL